MFRLQGRSSTFDGSGLRRLSSTDRVGEQLSDEHRPVAGSSDADTGQVEVAVQVAPVTAAAEPLLDSQRRGICVTSTLGEILTDGRELRDPTNAGNPVIESTVGEPLATGHRLAVATRFLVENVQALEG